MAYKQNTPLTGFKKIHIGTFINHWVTESSIEIFRICNFFKCKESEVTEMYKQENITTDMLLKWSKLLDMISSGDFSQHLLLVCSTAKYRLQQINHEKTIKPSSFP